MITCWLLWLCWTFSCSPRLYWNVCQWLVTHGSPELRSIKATVGLFECMHGAFMWHCWTTSVPRGQKLCPTRSFYMMWSRMHIKDYRPTFCKLSGQEAVGPVCNDCHHISRNKLVCIERTIALEPLLICWSDLVLRIGSLGECWDFSSDRISFSMNFLL